MVSNLGALLDSMPLPSGDSVISSCASERAGKKAWSQPSCSLAFLPACVPACLPACLLSCHTLAISVSRCLNSLNRCRRRRRRRRRRRYPFKVNGPAGYNDRIQLFCVSYIYKARLQSIFNIASQEACSPPPPSPLSSVRSLLQPLVR